MIVSVPTGKLVLVIEAEPPLNVADPNTRVPLKKVTVPVGLGPAELTVAVSVTAWPDVDGLRLEVTVVVDGYALTDSASALAPAL